MCACARPMTMGRKYGAIDAAIARFRSLSLSLPLPLSLSPSISLSPFLLLSTDAPLNRFLFASDETSGMGTLLRVWLCYGARFRQPSWISPHFFHFFI